MYSINPNEFWCEIVIPAEKEKDFSWVITGRELNNLETTIGKDGQTPFTLQNWDE